MGPPSGRDFQDFDPPPDFKLPSKASGAGYDHPGRCKALETSRAPGVYCTGLEHPWSLGLV